MCDRVYSLGPGLSFRPGLSVGGVGVMNTDLETGCALPILQAGVTGVIVGVLVLAIGLYNDLPRIGYAALSLGAGAALVVWVSGLRTWRSVTFRQDPVYTSPPAPPDPVQVQVTYDQDGARHHQLQDLPIEYDKMRTLAEGLLSGATFAESVWCGSGRPFSKSEFHQLRHVMLKRGWLQWRNSHAPSQGVQLSKPGAAVMRGFCATTTLPTSSRSLSDRVAR